MKRSPASAAAGKPVQKRTMGQLEADYERSQQEVSQMKAAAQHLLQRYVDLEAQAASLTSLYVSCHRLHTCIDCNEVLAAIHDSAGQVSKANVRSAVTCPGECGPGLPSTLIGHVLTVKSCGNWARSSGATMSRPSPCTW